MQMTSEDNPVAQVLGVGGDYFSLLLNLKPIPASRPRVTRWGVYYGKTYTQYRKDCDLHIPHAEFSMDKPLDVRVCFYLPRPKTSKFDTPMGDIDNYQKSIFDILTDKGYWDDDRQIVSVYAKKYFHDKNILPHTHMTVSTTRDVTQSLRPYNDESLR